MSLIKLLASIALVSILCLQHILLSLLLSSPSKGFHHCSSHRGVSGRSISSADPLHGSSEMSSSTPNSGTDFRGEDGGGGKTGGWRCGGGGNQVRCVTITQSETTGSIKIKKQWMVCYACLSGICKFLMAYLSAWSCSFNMLFISNMSFQFL